MRLTNNTITLCKACFSRYLEAKVKKRYYGLEQRLVEENLDRGRLPEILAFYTKHKDKGDFVKCRGSKPNPSQLPEDSDMHILAEIINRPLSYFLSADCDFHSMDEEIARLFQSLARRSFIQPTS